MKYQLIRPFTAVVLLLQAGFLWAQTNDSAKINNLSFGIDFMTHGEMMRGGLPIDLDDEPDDNSSFLLGLQAHAVVQNKSVWGTHGAQALKLYEGWAKMTAKCGLFAQVGRVALAYDDERIIGPNDFAMASLSHDILRVGYEGYGHQVHAILAYNQSEDNVYSSTYYDNGDKPYKTMQTVWYHYDVPKFPLGVSLLFMNVGLQAGVKGSEENKPSTEYQQMYGGYLNYHHKKLTVEGSYYKQVGKSVDARARKARDMDAWMASGKVTVNPNDYYGFTLGYDYLSGDDKVIVPSPGDIGLGLIYHETNKGFCPLFASRNKFYGIMDYFYQSAYINGFTPGLQNAFIGAFGKPTRKMDLSATYHYLAVATEIDNLNRTLGHSIDLQAGYQFTKDISLNIGYTLMFSTETMYWLKQGNESKRARWGWFSLNISPSLFSTKF